MLESLVYRRFGRILYNKNSQISSSFFQLKESFTPEEQHIILDRLPNKRRNDLFVEGNPFPTSLKELGKAKYLQPASTFQKEANWLLLSIKRYYKKLNLFLTKKKEYENFLILGNYEKALEILNFIEKEISYSIWGIENKFIVIDSLLGFEENRRYLNHVNEEAEDSFIKVLSYFYSQKADTNISISKYTNTIDEILKNLSPHIKNYFYFKLNLSGLNIAKSPRFILSFESTNSLIDRYQTFIELTHILLSSSKESLPINALAPISYLTKRVKEPRLKKILIAIHPEKGFGLSDLGKELFQIEDFFWREKYNECIERCIINLKKFPTCFKLYELYIESITSAGLEFSDNNIRFSASIQKQLLCTIYKIYSTSDSVVINEALGDLVKLALKISNLDFSYSILDFIERARKGYSSENERLSKFSSVAINADFVKYFHEDSNKVLVLDEIAEKLPNIELIKNLIWYYSKNSETNFSSNFLPDKSEKIWLGNYFFKEKAYNKAEELFLKLLKYEDISIHSQQDITLKLLLIYLHQSKLSLASKLLVDFYFNHEGLPLSLSINGKYLIKTIKSNKFKQINHDINLPILFYLLGASEQDIHTSSELFVLSKERELPNEINYIEYDIEPEKVVFFLSKICTAQVYKHSPFIINDKNRLLERINTCKYLINIDEENSEKYELEIEEINKKLIIQEGLKDIDESKIYIDEDGIYNYELDEVKKSFQNYQRLKNSNSGGLKILVLDGLEVFEFGSFAERKNKDVNYSEDPLYTLFQEMFLEIRDKFLSSKFGLVAYLSTRIRHGVFMGELRPEFSSLNLITVKGKDEKSEYLENKYWKDKCSNLSKDINRELQKLLGKFSSDIDELITSIVKDFLQLKTKGEAFESTGWFNYDFSKIDLYFLYLRTSDELDYDTFVKASLQFLWQRTEENLHYIRTNISGEIKKRFVFLIETLEKDLKNLLNDVSLPEIFTNLNNCKSAVSTKLDRIARWFVLSDRQIPDFLIEKVLDISLERSNKSYQDKSLELSKHINCNITIKGVFFVHLVDLVCIFFNNILEHAALNGSVVKSKINVIFKKNKINLEIINPLKDGVSASTIKKETDERLSILRKTTMNNDKLRTEGNSGFFKADKILKTDLKNNENKMAINITEEDGFQVVLTISSNEIIV